MEVYLDNSATTRAYDSVRDIVAKTMCEDYGNPSSMHKKGVEAEKYVRGARETLARLMKVQEKEIFFCFWNSANDSFYRKDFLMNNAKNLFRFFQKLSG